MTRQCEQGISDVRVTDHNLSDHYLITFNIKMGKPPAIRKQVQYRKLQESDICEAFNSVQGDSVSDLVNKYNNNLSGLLDKHAPLQTKMITLRPNAPWYTNEIREAKREKRKCERKWRQTKEEVQNQVSNAQHHEMDSYTRNSVRM
jgi:hypothetical protein